MFLHASKDQTVSVGGSSSTTVGANETHSVDLAYTLSVQGTQSSSIGASQAVDVGTNYAIGVKGGRSESIGGAEIVSVTANRAVVAKGTYTELVGGFYGLQCNQSNTTVAGAFLQGVGGAMVLASGLGTSESVASVRTEVVGGMRNIVAAGAFAETVRGPKKLTAGAVSESSNGPHTTKALASGTIKVGGSAKLSASGDFVIEAPVITIQVAGSLVAGALELAGGALKAQSGTTALKGTIKRQAGAKVSG